MLDYHIHSSYSVDSKAVMADVCQRAVELGISEIAFTEHMDFIPEEANTGYFQYEPYIAEIARCQELFSGKLTVMAAVEIDYCHDFEDEIRSWIKHHAFDFVVGSVHYLRHNGNISEPRASDFFDGRSVSQAYGLYFEAVLHSAESKLFDSLGHMDLVKRYGVKKYGPLDVNLFQEPINKILRTIIDNGMCLELNGSGLRQSPQEIYPAAGIVDMYFALGGTRITTGSDSHRVQDVGKGLEIIYRNLQRAGCDEVLSFRDRRPLSISISELSDGASKLP